MAGRAGAGYGYSGVGGMVSHEPGRMQSKARLSMDGGKSRRPGSGGLRADDSGLSAASTPVRNSPQDWRTAPSGDGAGSFTWSDSDERFILSGGSSQRNMDVRLPLPVLNGRLFYATASADPPMQSGVFFFSVEKTLKYMPFCADFGPFNLGMTHSFCLTLKEHLLNPRLRDSKIVFYSSPEPNGVTNAVYLLGAFMVTFLGMSPEQAWLPFASITPSPCRPYRDATWAPSPFDLTVQDCWAGLVKAKTTGLYDPVSFDKEEYKYYDHPANGDMHEVVKKKFFAFKGPTGKRKALGYGRYSLIPSDYFDVWRFKNITMVIRLNSKEYDRNSVVQGGFKHVDLFFIDCSTPSDAIVDKFLRISEEEPGAIAVHCLAGLGRTGTLIAMYMMKHYRFTARQAMGWLRICRPGSVIGPQQQYLVQQEKRMWEIGDRRVAGLGLGGVPLSLSVNVDGPETSNDPEINKLAEMVTKGMRNREMSRVVPSQDTISASKPMSGNAHVRQSASLLANNSRSGSGGSAYPTGAPASPGSSKSGSRGSSASSQQTNVQRSPDASPSYSAARPARGPTTHSDADVNLQPTVLRSSTGSTTPTVRTPNTTKRQQNSPIYNPTKDPMDGSNGSRGSPGSPQKLRMSVR